MFKGKVLNENSFRRLFVVLALVMTFSMVQTAWSGILDGGDIAEIRGIFWPDIS